MNSRTAEVMKEDGQYVVEVVTLYQKKKNHFGYQTRSRTTKRYFLTRSDAELFADTKRTI